MPRNSARFSIAASAFLLSFAVTLSAAFAASGGSIPPTAKAESVASGSARGFDFYVLSLSWSPSYCAVEGPKANKYQCGKHPAFGFVVHGLWPQYEHGYPKDCQSDAERRVPRQRMNALSDLMPGYGLIIHEWRTHGLCTGLSQEVYFAALRKAYEHIVIPERFKRHGGGGSVRPDGVESAFIDANPGMPKDGVSVDCDRRYLREVRICLSKDLQFRSCPELERSTCRKTSVEMPAS